VSVPTKEHKISFAGKFSGTSGNVLVTRGMGIILPSPASEAEKTSVSGGKGN
jgi:hypothetical protein